MTREEQAKKDCAIIVSDDMEYGTPVSIAYNKGVEAGVKWADSHPIIHKDTLEQLVEGIKSGKVRTLSEYSNKPELSKAFDDGQIAILNLLLTWITYKQKESEK